jgi:hypothetical protein
VVRADGPLKERRQIALELPIALADELDAFAARRSEKKWEIVAQALRRHMDNPPKVVREFQPLPPVPTALGTPKPMKSAIGKKHSLAMHRRADIRRGPDFH